MKKPVIVLLHLAYWLIYTFLFAFAVFAYTIDTKDTQGQPLAHSINIQVIGFLLVCFFLNSVLAFYTSYFVLFPKLLQQKKILLLVLTGIITVFASVMVSIGVVFALTGHFLIGEVAPGIILIMGIITGVHALLGLVLRGFITAYGDIRVKEELKRKNLEMELALIKAKINPHFLFNTINNIDVLIHKDANLASGYLNQLSDILRYMLYETKTEKVSFDKEIQHIEKYLDLQKLRSSNPGYIHFQKNGNGNPMIAPMLFMPFIENAVKYAENKKTDKAIQISFDVNNERVIFECQNAYTVSSDISTLKGGLGQDLALKRLDLLYRGQYHISINDKDGTYAVKLVILFRE